MDRQMAIEEILVNMEETLENAKSIPFSDKVMVNREELFDFITDIRLKMPNEIEQSKWVLDEKNRIIQDAKREAEQTIKEAEEEREKLVDESEVTRLACEQAESIVSEAKKVAKDMRLGAKEYADDLLMQMEEQMKQLDTFMQNTMRDVRVALDNQTKTFSDALLQKEDVVRQNRKELNVTHTNN